MRSGGSGPSPSPSSSIRPTSRLAGQAASRYPLRARPSAPTGPEAAVRWGLNRDESGKASRTQPFRRREPCACLRSLSLTPLAQSCRGRTPDFAAATGRRPEEWLALEPREIDRRAGLLDVGRTVSSGVVVELAKTKRSRRQISLSPRALSAIDALAPRLDTPLLFPSAGRRSSTSTTSAIASGHPPSSQLASVDPPGSTTCARRSRRMLSRACITLFELARVIGTSVEMLERHYYGALLDGSGASMTARLAAFEAEQERALGTLKRQPRVARLGHYRPTPSIVAP
jgi:hypothetical protein